MNATTTSAAETPQTHWLASCLVQFVSDVEKEEISNQTISTIVATAEPYLRMTGLTKIHQGAQITLYNQLQEQVPVVNIVILSVSNLGVMLPSEFIADMDVDTSTETIN